MKVISEFTPIEKFKSLGAISKDETKYLESLLDDSYHPTCILKDRLILLASSC
jgi:hypothetical protein